MREGIKLVNCEINWRLLIQSVILLYADDCLTASEFCRSCRTLLRLFSPPENDSFRKDLSFTRDVLFFFLPTRDLRDACADRREILHDGQY